MTGDFPPGGPHDPRQNPAQGTPVQPYVYDQHDPRPGEVPEWPDPMLFGDRRASTLRPPEARFATEPGDGSRRYADQAPPGRPAPGRLYLVSQDAGDGWPGSGPPPGQFPGQGQAATYTPTGYTARPDADRRVAGLRQESSADAAMSDLRNRVVNRLFTLNVNQAAYAWERRRRDPLNPHALVFCFAEPPTDAPPRRKLAIAWRLFLGSDEPELPRLLRQLHKVIETHQASGAFDPRVSMVNTCEDMSANAAYVGLAVSSLGNLDRSWAQVQKAAHGDIDVPGRCYAVMTDGARLVMDRHAEDLYGRVEVRSTHHIQDVSGQISRGWTRATDTELDAEHRDTHTWTWLTQIHDLLRGRRAH